MLKIEYYELNSVEENQIKYAVIMAKYDNRWIFVRQKDRATWEMPAGTKEENETINDTASRELFEETGAESFNIVPLCIYSVDDGEQKNYGQLFYAEVESLGELPNFEIGEIMLSDRMPDHLTYPLIQTSLFNWAKKNLKI